nr:hypothetical protein [Streptomyces sp. RLB1-33]QIY72942.1 hypothetical protein HEP84_31145 [Streptomyces sp. RLB1-33]
MLTTGTTRTADNSRTTRTIGSARTISITGTTHTTRPTSFARITTSVLTTASPRKGRS